MDEFIQNLFNKTGLREFLRKRFPEIEKLETLYSLKDLRLTRIDANEDFPFIFLDYEAIATKDLYPNVRARLIELGFNNLRVDLKEKEYESVTFFLNENNHKGAEVKLKVYNPDYKPG